MTCHFIWYLPISALIRHSEVRMNFITSKLHKVGILLNCSTETKLWSFIEETLCCLHDSAWNTVLRRTEDVLVRCSWHTGSNIVSCHTQNCLNCSRERVIGTHNSCTSARLRESMEPATELVRVAFVTPAAVITYPRPAALYSFIGTIEYRPVLYLRVCYHVLSWLIESFDSTFFKYSLLFCLLLILSFS